MIAHRLPVSGLDVVVQVPTGAEDVLLVEAGTPSVQLAIALLARLVRRLDGTAIDWMALAPTDLDVMLLLLRRRVLGDVVTTDVVCSADGCRARVDLSFSIMAFLHHHRPQAVDGLRTTRDGWFALADARSEFRLPHTGDQLAIALDDDPELALVERCIRAEQLDDEERAHIEDAMEALAPSLVSELQGTCPECGAVVVAELDPLRYTLRELRDQAVEIYDEVCTIAAYTHWSENEILALPTSRRLRYAELVHDRTSR